MIVETLAFCRCRPEMVVGWYHSHPGFGCWLSGVDINTQQVFGCLFGFWFLVSMWRHLFVIFCTVLCFKIETKWKIPR